MLKRFYPDLMVDRVQDIETKALTENNIKGLILDIDNTLVPTHVKEADENALAWIERMKREGFKLCIVSNASRKRVIKFNEGLKLFAIHRAFKPGTKAFKKALRLMDLKENEAAVVGDQIFTDIYGGRKLGLYTILTKPLAGRESVFIGFKRLLEKYIIRTYKKMKGE